MRNLTVRTIAAVVVFMFNTTVWSCDNTESGENNSINGNNSEREQRYKMELYDVFSRSKANTEENWIKYRDNKTWYSDDWFKMLEYVRDGRFLDVIDNGTQEEFLAAVKEVGIWNRYLGSNITKWNDQQRKNIIALLLKAAVDIEIQKPTMLRGIGISLKIEARLIELYRLDQYDEELI
jgi:hypothetical protein